MKTKKFGRRNFIKYGLIYSSLLLSGCSISKRKLALRGVENTFPSEFVDSLSSAWEFVPIKNIESKEFPYKSTLQEKTDLLVLNDGWISDLPFSSLKEIKNNNFKKNLSKQATSFLDGLGEGYKNRVLPLAVSPWVILLRNKDSLTLKNKNSWELILSRDLKNQIVFPKSPYLLISIAQKIGLFNSLSIIKSQARSFDDRNALNWVVSGRARAAVLPLSSCVGSLMKDPRLSILFPIEGSPLNWTVLASPKLSMEPFPFDWLDSVWGPVYSKRIIRKGFLPPIDFSYLSRKNIDVSQRYKSIFLPAESVWKKRCAAPIISMEEKKDLALNWNNS